MKASRYNHFVTIADYPMVLAWNAGNGALAEIESAQYPRVQELLRSPGAAHGPEDGALLQCLSEGGFLVADGVNEAACVRTRSRDSRLTGTLLTLTVAPTMACNFACDYCFASCSSARMNEATQEALLRFTDRQLRRAEALRLCWFGGEPTLCIDMLLRLQEQFVDLAAQHQVEVVPGTIITNGYVLDGAMACALKDVRIGHAQVTIDGPRAVHDSRRKLRNGKGSFDRIIQNLEESSEILRINVRINVDRGNVDSACEVVELLNERHILPRVRLHFAQVTTSGATCADIRDRCQEGDEFARALLQIYRSLVDRGLYRVELPEASAGAPCGAVADGYYVVSPTGHLFKCWEDLSLDEHHSIGTVFSNVTEEFQKVNHHAYLGWNPFVLSNCRDCDVLPVCLGGCPARLADANGSGKGTCPWWRNHLDEMLELAYRSLLQAETQDNL